MQVMQRSCSLLVGVPLTVEYPSSAGLLIAPVAVTKMGFGELVGSIFGSNHGFTQVSATGAGEVPTKPAAPEGL